MRLLRKLKIFFRLKWEETFIVLFKSIKANRNKILKFIGITSLISLCLFLVGLITYFYGETSIVKFLYFMDDKGIIFSPEAREIFNNSFTVFTIMMIISGLFLSICVVCDTVILFSLITVVCLAVVSILAFFKWIYLNWKQAEAELSKLEDDK